MLWLKPRQPYEQRADIGRLRSTPRRASASAGEPRSGSAPSISMSRNPAPAGRAASQAERLRAEERLARLIAQILANGEEASFWAEHCGWIAGTGRCRMSASAGCRTGCLFAPMREAEAEAIQRARQRRRRS